MSTAELHSRSREDLEAEVLLLRAALVEAGVDPLYLEHRSPRSDAPHDGDIAEKARAAAQATAQYSDDQPTTCDQREAAQRLQRSDDASQSLIDALNASRKALANSEARQRAIFESAADFAMIITDPAGIITDWNPGAERAMGWTAAEMRGRDASRVFTPEDQDDDRVTYEMRQALAEGRASDERWHMRKDGQRFWASGEMMPLFDGGTHLGFVKILRDRTSEHLSGIILAETQERYRLAGKATNDAVWDWDLTNNRVHWNEALERTYGHVLTRAEMTGEWWISQIHPDDQARIDSSIHAVIDGSDDAWTDGYRFRRSDGSYAEVLDRGHVIRDADGRAVRMIGAMLDLTKMRSAEAALSRSEARFRTVLETIDVAFAIVQVKFDADDRPVNYRFVEANPAFEKQAGVNLRGKWVTEFAPDLERFWFETYGHVAKTGEPATFENYAKNFERWFDVRAIRVGEPHERQIAILFNDTTERRSAEERLRFSEALARENVERVQLALAAGAIIGTWHWDIPSDRFTVDEGFARAFGLDPSLSRKGLSLEQVVATVHPDDQKDLAAAIGEAIARGGAYAHQYRVLRTDGEYHWIEANGRVDHSSDGKPTSFPGVVIDVAERRALLEERDRALHELRELNETLEQRVTERSTELLRAEEALRQSQKMEAVGQLTGGLAHDFNNLLAGISGALELIQTRLAQGRLNDVEKYVFAAQGASKRAAALTHRLLAFSRRQTLDPKPTNVNSLIGGMTDLIQRTVGPAIQVETVGASGLWPALVDASQLENSLLNLCINARDAMPDGGRITIETANKWLDLEAARAHDVPSGQYLSLCVTDTGTGMSPDIVAKVFDPFFTTKPIGQGTGLGLSMIYGFAKQSGGQVRIYSELGHGSTICIYLPRHYGDAETAGDMPKIPIEFAREGETVLVVDDEPTVRMLITDVLKDLGYAAIEAADSASGLKVLQSDVRIDLLISDVGLPGGMNGRQMADAGRERRRDLRVLFITGYAENSAIGNGYLAPGMEVLTKPFAVDVLAARIRELLTR